MKHWDTNKDISHIRLIQDGSRVRVSFFDGDSATAYHLDNFYNATFSNETSLASELIWFSSLDQAEEALFEYASDHEFFLYTSNKYRGDTGTRYYLFKSPREFGWLLYTPGQVRLLSKNDIDKVLNRDP